MRLFVGEDRDYSRNAECDGGPFLMTSDPNSYVKVTYRGGGISYQDQDVWKYGAEVWCNR